MELASCAHFGCQTYVASFLSGLLGKVRAKELEVVALCQKIAQDETTLQFRGQGWKSGDPTCKAAASALKVVQSRTSVHVPCKKPVVPPQPAQFFLFNLRLTTPSRQWTRQPARVSLLP